ncbi:MAG: enoyl-CoA hydratase-related protein [Maritimibacter sp.]
METVTVEIRDAIGWVTIDSPPVNALGQSVRQGLMEAVTQLAEADVQAVVLTGAGRTFVAGADIRELGKTPAEPYLPDVLAAIAAAPVPWIAAINGMARGGGLEVAMACHARIAAPSAKLGLPEVNIGIIPGSGGTVRLPRLVPMATAIKLVTSGKPIGAQEALDAGLVDRLSGEDLLGEAAAMARDLAEMGRPKPALERDLVAGDPIDWDAQASQLRKRSRGAAAPLEALASLKCAASEPVDVALAGERERFLRLAASDEAAALRHIFFAERAAGKGLKQAQADPVDLSRVGVIVVPVAKGEAALAELSTGADYAALADCPLVIEAVFEDLDVKRQVFETLDAIMPAEAILATNTSYLDVNVLAQTTRDPSRILGLHFFSPAHVMKLLEVVRGEATSARALATGGALAKLLRKIPVVAGVCDGFIGNRIMAAYRRECEFMLEEGALPQQIDAAMQEFGFAMGIYAVQDMSGLDIAWAQRKARAPQRDPAERYARIADRLCEAGRLGRKTGKGWYDYSSGKAEVDPEVTRIIEEESARAGRERTTFTAPEIMARILGTMQREGQAVLDEGIAESADDIDVVMITGYGFPRHKGGPMYLANKTG